MEMVYLCLPNRSMDSSHLGFSRTVEDLRVAKRTVETQAQAAAEEALGQQRHVEEMELQQKAMGKGVLVLF